MSQIEVTTEVAIDAYDVTHCGLNRIEIMDFILAIDEELADLEFTIKLRDKLTKAIEEELK